MKRYSGTSRKNTKNHSFSTKAIFIIILICVIVILIFKLNDSSNAIEERSLAGEAPGRCTDSDPQNDPLVFGSVRYNTKSYDDTCVDASRVKQYSCTRTVGSAISSCPSGSTCSNGFCSPCGDRVLDKGESCDDGNRLSGDGCSDVCNVESGWTCSLPPGNPCQQNSVVCGNGIVEGTETCDDGNTNSTDECTNRCTKAACGDGIIRQDIARDWG